MIGLSVSLCVKDILDGKVREEDVCLIIAGTRAGDRNGFHRVVGGYVELYWVNAPVKACDIAWRLWNAGKIFESRCHTKGYACGEAPNTADGHWLHVTLQPSLPLEVA